MASLEVTILGTEKTRKKMSSHGQGVLCFERQRKTCTVVIDRAVMVTAHPSDETHEDKYALSPKNK